MDYGFSEEQEMFRRSVRNFLKRECSRSLVREIEEKRLGYSSRLYHLLVEQGWSGMMIPEEYGGLGGDWVDMAIFYEEAGRALLQSPHFDTVVLAGQLILRLATEEQKRNLLPKIVSGDTTICMALIEEDTGLGPASCKTFAALDGDEFVVSGTKLFVRNADTAEFILMAAKTIPNADEGVALFLIDRTAPNLSYIPMDTFGGETLSEVVCEKVRVPRGNMIVQSIQGSVINDIVDKATILLCAELQGIAEVALEMSLEYSRQRIQFDQPIGSFQAMQHKLARMSMAIEGVKWLTYYTAWLSSQVESCPKELAMARLWAGEMCRFVIAEAEQTHGGIGIMYVHDLTLYSRRARVIKLSLGYRPTLQQVIARSLGL